MKATAKVAAVAAGLAMATSMLSLAPIAHAATCSVSTFNLTIGSTGSGVTCLQQGLIAAGYSIPAGATGYFGTQTKAAVAAWQSASNIAPAVGYFGPISRAAWLAAGGSSGGTTVSTVPGCAVGAMFSATTGQSCTTTSTVAGCAPGANFSATTGQACTTTVTTYPAGCTSSVGFSPTTGQSCSSGTVVTTGVSGAGTLINVDYLGNVTSDIKNGDSATSVIGISADAVGGDIALQRLDATFVISAATINGAVQSANLNKYVSDVSLWLNGTKIASMDPAMGLKSGSTWTLRFSGLNGVIKDGTTGNLYVKVTPLTSIGSHEDGGTVTASLQTDSLRAVGADGISDTYVTNVAADDQAFTVKSVTSGTLTVTAAGDNPTASQIAVSSSTTTGVKLLSFNMKAKNQDVTVDALDVNFMTNDSLSDVIATAYLMKGSKVLTTKTVSSGPGQIVTFNNLGQAITKDSTDNYTVVVDLKGDSAYADGTTLIASTTASGGGWDVSDANGATVTPSAGAVGNSMTLTATGISLAKGTTSTTNNNGSQVANGDDVGTFVIPFTVTAGDNDVFISGTAKDVKGGGVAGTDNIFATTTTSGANKTGQPTANFTAANTVTGDSATGVYYKVLAGTSRTFTLTVSYTGSTATGYTGLRLISVGYGLTSSVGSTYSSNMDTFKTNDILLIQT